MRLVSSLLITITLLIGAVAQADTPPAERVPPTQCGPGQSGDPCDGMGPASQGNSSGTNQGAGNPINVITGNKYQQETDLPALPGVLGLEIVRHYNSALASTPPGILGRGWRLSYETEVYPVGNTLQVMQADGTRILFIRDPKNPGQCASNNPAHGRLAITRTARGEEYVWTWPNGRTLRFNHLGKLIQIKVPTGEFVTLTRDPAGLLMKVTDPQGRSLVFGYPARSAGRFNGVSFIDSPVGRFTYTYGSVAPQGYAGNPRELLANLADVTLPGGVRRQYHYEDAARPAFLTGISVADKDGKPQRVATWAYDSQGRGILSVRGEPRRLGQDGKPLPGTGIEQVELRYTAGKTLLTNSLGQTTVYTHAIVGNEYRLLEVRGAGCASCGEANVRYGYDALGRLASETKLSPDGRPLATTKTERDTLGRVLRESRIDYVNGRAQPARLIARFEYAGQSHAPSLIARPSVIPGKEAVTRITYNDYGQPLSITEHGFSPLNDKGQASATPISRTTTYAYRTINKRSLLVAIDGPLQNGPGNDPSDSDVTRVEYDARGRAVAVISPGNLRRAIRYDAAGAIAAVGETPWPSRSAPAVPAPGEGQPPSGTVFDGLARPVAWQAGGVTVLKASWGEAGTAAQFRLLSMTGAAGQVRRQIDDFGRVVAVRNPGMGWQTAVYDAAGRLVRIVDPRGAVQVAQYDFANRLLRLGRYRPGQAVAEETLTLRWQGRWQTEAAVTDAEGVRRTLWRHDAQGRLFEETQDIALKNRPPVRFSVRRQWHEAGERIELADALKTHSTLIQARDAQGRIENVRLEGALPGWLGGGRSLVRQVGWTNVAGTPFAERIVYGDGRTDRWPLAADRGGDASARTVAFAGSPYGAGLVRPGERHDIAGLPAAIDTGAGRLALDWDAAGRLREIRQGDTREHFIYDAQGRRIAKRIGSHIRYFAWDGIQLAGEADERGRLLTRYAYLGYRPVAQIVAPQGAWQRFMAWLIGPEARTYSTSRAGRVLAMHDADGRVLWQDAETPGLRRVSLPKTLHQPLRDVGQYADDESGLVYHVARFFDPNSGLFLSPDPKGIADAVEDTRFDLILNPYAYAGGYPDEFFDPDGAAKIRYYAITTGERDRNQGYGPLGQTQGFTHARWAFVIYDIQGGAGNATDLGRLRNHYAATNTGLLFDGRGNFIGGANDPLTGIINPTRTAIKQEGGILALSEAFVSHYAGNIISLPQFDIEFDDDHATKLIWYLMGKAEIRAQCRTSAPGWLPEIRFHPGEADIRVTQANANGANKQRILNCQRPTSLPVVYASDEERRRIEKYEAAAELQESPATSAIYRDCSANHGCRSATDITVNGHSYYASYGRTQFVAETFLRTLQTLIPNLAAQERQQLGLNQAVVLPNGRQGTMADMVRIALQRATRTGDLYRRHRTRFNGPVQNGSRQGLSEPAAQAAWNALTPQERANFTRDTGLGQAEFMDMLMYTSNGRARTEEEGLNAFAAEAAMRLLDGNGQPVFRDWLMGLYSSQDQYNFISRRFLQDNLSKIIQGMPAGYFNNPHPSGSNAWHTRQREIEEELARRVGVLHNSGNLELAKRRDLNTLPSHLRAYMNEFASVAGRGDWKSLRCADDSRALRDLPGLQMNPLELK